MVSVLSARHSNTFNRGDAMPKFIQIQPITVHVRKPGGTIPVETEEIELFALGDDGKVYRYSYGGCPPQWQVVE